MSTPCPDPFKGHRFPREIISYAVWLYYRFSLSLRDVEELLAFRGIEASYETVRNWEGKFGTLYADAIRRNRPKPGNKWHLDEAVIKIRGEIFYLWRAVDQHGDVLDIMVQKRRNKKAARRFLSKLVKQFGQPRVMITDKLRSYGAAKLIAQAMRTGLFKATHVKTDRSQRLRLLLRHRQSIVHRNKDLINTVRGTLKAFGIRTGGGKKTLYARRVREAIDDPMLLAMTEPLLAAYEDGLRILAELDRMVLKAARDDQICRLLMTVPGVGAVTALAFRTGVDVPCRFDKSRLVGAIFGLTPRVHASGETEQIGRITKCGDGMVRWLLYEAANVMMTRCKADN